jgi:hypothetical protein
MNNIYVYEGHTNQTINKESLPIKTGNDLFNKSRIKVPENYRFITFHFNDTPTGAKSTGPFILYGLKEINLDDINSLFDNNECEKKVTVELNNFRQIECKNIRDANIIKFKRKMFKSFVINYIDFISTTEYSNSQTFLFSEYNIKKTIFNNSKHIIKYFTSVVDKNFDKICKLYEINIDKYDISGNISTFDIFDSIINSKGTDFYDLLNFFELNDLLESLPGKNRTEITNQYEDAYIANEGAKFDNLKIDDYCNKILTPSECNVDTLLYKYKKNLLNIFYENIRSRLGAIKEYKKEKENQDKNYQIDIDIIKTKFKENEIIKKILTNKKDDIKKDFVNKIKNENNIEKYLTKENIIDYIKKNNLEGKIDKTKLRAKFSTYNNYESYAKTKLNNKLMEYYENKILINGENILINWFKSTLNQNIINKPVSIDEFTKSMIKNNMKKKMINILKNIILLDNNIIDKYKRIGNIQNIILDRDLINEFYFNFFVLLLNKHIETIQNDNRKEILNYLYLDNILYNKEEKIQLQTNPWGNVNEETKESSALINIRKPFRILEDSINKFDQDLIDRICIHFKFNIRSYASTILTPILSFGDKLSFDYEYTDNHVEWETYKYGFFPLEKYQNLKELCHGIYDKEPDRRVKYGLSEYSSIKKIPSKLRFYDERYTFAETKLNEIITHYNSFFNIFEFTDYELRYIRDNDRLEYDNTNFFSHINNVSVNYKIFVNDIIKTIEEEIVKIKKIKDYENKPNYSELYMFYLHYKNTLLLLTNGREDIRRNIDYFTDFEKSMVFVIKFHHRIYHNFFNYTDPGTYIITSCGSFTENLNKVYKSLDHNLINLPNQNKVYESLDHNLIKLPNQNSDNFNKELTRTLLKREQGQFNRKTTEYDTYWENKYLKYKQKYLYLKRKKNNI